MHALWLFAGWPQGGIYSNLLASVLWVPVAAFFAWLWARAKLAAHRAEMHARHDEHAAQIADLHAKVDAIRTSQQTTPIGTLDDGTPVHIDGAQLFREVERQRIRNHRRNGGPHA